jgi:peptidoglycan glycosyltransferase
MNRALRRVSIAALVMFVLLLANDNYLQGFESNSLRTEPGNARAFAQQFQQQRGDILTAGGTVIAGSRPASGIYKFQRYYPNGPLYAPVTGYDSIYGASGLELAEDKLLSGTDPRLTVRRWIDLISGKKPSGASVVTTIQDKAQQAAYNALKATGETGGVVALNPQTGGIIAMTSDPSFDPNKYTTFSGSQLDAIDNAYRNDPSQPLLDRAINATYPPGSTFKVVTSSAAFSSGRYSPQSLIDAPTNLTLPLTSTQLINFDNEACFNGKPPIIQAFTVSCNTAFANLGMQVGQNAIRSQAQAFGMNNPNLKIPMPVSESNYPPGLNEPQTAMSAVGQFNDQVTPLQEAMFSAGIANGGQLMSPYLVQQVKAPDLSTLESASPQPLGQAVSSSVAGQVKQMMASVVNDPLGTAHASAQIPGVQVYAKTGTAQNGINNTGLDDAVFTCFAQSGSQQIAVGVVVKGGGQGADAAAPVAVQVIKAYLGLS